MFKRISVIGLGYIGLPTAAVIASNNIHVVGVDINKYAVDTINQGNIHIVEPGLRELVKSAVSQGYLKAFTEPQKADAFLMAVPTPFKGKNFEADLKYIESASRALAPLLEKGNLVVLESTSPVGATEQMAKWLAEERPDLTFPHQMKNGLKADICIAHCPERVLPGQVIRELVENDRIIGGLDEHSTTSAIELYKLFVKKGECIATNARTAEMSKLTENAFRDVNIAFANELSLICDKQGINVWELISLANRHPRVNILQPGCGVGGHCIAVDPWFIVNQNPELAKLIHQARLVNDYKPQYVIEKISQVVVGLRNPKIACLGLAFKPDIDDLRESPALEITKRLADNPANRLLVVEPNIDDLPSALKGRNNVKLVSLYEALEQADIVLVLVKHKEFKGLINKKYTSATILDFVNAAN